ncbi:MAG: DUF1573 domain-containing protein [Bacteroidetes bacterium]|nr:DUF1573 domain-containing protein [Bacteroidota bacterium]
MLYLLRCSRPFLAHAQDAKTATSTAEITFEKELYDYGTIDYASDGSYAFKFTNTGKDPLVITNATGSCGCTVPKWPKEPILKGQSAYINVTYDTKRPGPFTKTVTINSNAKSASKVITIKGVVRSQEQTDDQMPLKKDNGLSPLENHSK